MRNVHLSKKIILHKTGQKKRGYKIFIMLNLLQGGDLMEWLQHLSKAIDYIEDNLDGDICYEEAARIACSSTYYFQRMFSYITGISLAEYIRRRRMTAAAFDLQTSNIKIIDVAMKYGYKSPTAFNRAFQNVHGVNPTASRIKGTLLNSYSRIRFSISVTGGEGMRYRIEEKKPFRIVGIRIPLREDSEYNFKIVPQFWNEILDTPSFDKICSMAKSDFQNVLGISFYIDPQNIYYYIAVRTDEPIPEGMVELKIPEATWVVFESDGHFKESVPKIFKNFLTEWLPFSGYEYANLPDIEVYPINYNDQKESHVEVWIAVKKKI